MTQTPIHRRPTHTVFVGQVALGGNNPIRIQSMTTSDTKDTDGIVKEIQDLVNAGCEMVRLTVPTKADCANLKNIKAELKKLNIRVPLVADIHFTPSVAMDVVEYVDKVRINPGNFVDKKLFKTLEYTDEQYAQELERIEETFTPLVLKCKEHGVAMRVGTNHGSLSDRIMNRYGDTPQGMVESALEFLRIAAKNDYHDIVLSMKASNTQVMVAAYRLLAQKLKEEGMTHPFHLGVTEAGDGEDGRIKSAVGIGTLLEEGIGDTIRVSLTEDSIHEIPVAGMIAAPYNHQFYQNQFLEAQNLSQNKVKFSQRDFSLSYERRPAQVKKIGHLPTGGKETVAVWNRLDHLNALPEFLKAQTMDIKFDGVELSPENYSDDVVHDLKAQSFAMSVISDKIQSLSECPRADKWAIKINSDTSLSKLSDFFKTNQPTQHIEWVLDGFHNKSELKTLVQALAKISFDTKLMNASFSLITESQAQSYRDLVQILDEDALQFPVHLRYEQHRLPVMTDAPAQLGGLLLDGIGDSIQVDFNSSYSDRLSQNFTLLQACRVRITKTEFIACPSCGRTLFDLQKVTARIRAKTSHLKGLKLAIMGCIVNGPGEMADADFGYVGTGTGKISLYVGKECVTRNIPEAQALDRLIELIKEHGRWVDESVAA